MRIEVIKCDTCGKDHDPQYALPPEWIETTQRDIYGHREEEKHFCSKSCLIIWAKGQTLSELGQNEQRQGLKNHAD